MHVSAVPIEARRGQQISGGGLIGCCEPPDLGAENYWPIAEHRLLLTKHQVISAVL